jgi:hypothetical protein
MTAAAGLSRYWRDLMSAYASTWTVAGGEFRNWYIVAIMDGSTFKDAFMFDLSVPRAYRISNLHATGFVNAVGMTGEELYFGDRGEPRMHSFSSVFSPAAGVKNDADGTAVAPVLETGYFSGKSQDVDKIMRGLYTTYYMTDASSDNPTLTVSYIKRIEDAYTALSSTLGEVTATQAPKRLWLGGSTGAGIRGPGIALKYAQSNASAVTRIHRIGIDTDDLEGGRTS